MTPDYRKLAGAVAWQLCNCETGVPHAHEKGCLHVRVIERALREVAQPLERRVEELEREAERGALAAGEQTDRLCVQIRDLEAKLATIEARVRREMLEAAADLAQYSGFVDGSEGTVEGQIARAIRALAPSPESEPADPAFVIPLTEAGLDKARRAIRKSHGPHYQGPIGAPESEPAPRCTARHTNMLASYHCTRPAHPETEGHIFEYDKLDLQASPESSEPEEEPSPAQFIAEEITAGFWDRPAIETREECVASLTRLLEPYFHHEGGGPADHICPRCTYVSDPTVLPTPPATESEPAKVLPLGHRFRWHSERGGAFCNQGELCHEPDCGKPRSAHENEPAKVGHRFFACDVPTCDSCHAYQCDRPKDRAAHEPTNESLPLGHRFLADKGGHCAIFHCRQTRAAHELPESATKGAK